jgi:hypothetical protein
MPLRRVLSSPAVFLTVLFAMGLVALAQRTHNDRAEPLRPIGPLGLQLMGPGPPPSPFGRGMIPGPRPRIPFDSVYRPTAGPLGSFLERGTAGVHGAMSATSIFLEPTTYGSGGYNPKSVIVADVNGDGKLDVLGVNECADSSCASGSVSVLLGNGDGTLQPPVTYSSGGQTALSLTAADVNGDGKLDLIVVNQCAPGCANSSVSVLLGNGDGTFLPAVTYSFGTVLASSAAVADVNGDGKPDLIVAGVACCYQQFYNYAAVGVLLGNGDGTFQTVVTYDSNPGGSSAASSVAVADVNRDGHPDLVVGNGSNVGVLLGNGDGTFQTAATFNTGGFGNTTAIAAADLNGDGKPDLVVANLCDTDSPCFSGAIGVLLGDGDGTFQTAVTYLSGGMVAFSVAVGDVNGDGIPDLLIANECDDGSSCSNGTVSLLLGNGDGTFGVAVSYDPGGYGSDAVAVGDVNGDGIPDVVVDNLCDGSSGCNVGQTGTGFISVLLGSGGGTFKAPVTYNPGGHYAGAVAVGDVNGDGKSDLLVADECTTNCSGDGSVGVLLGKGDGTFQPAVSYDSGGYEPIAEAVVDLNHDHFLDVVIVNSCGSASNCTTGAIGVLLGNGDGTFQSAISYGSGGEYPRSLAVGDVNGDGYPDLLVVNDCVSSSNCNASSVSLLLGNGDGSFQAATTIYSANGQNLFAVALADLNGDGHPDLLVGSNCGTCANGSVIVMLGNGNGTFQAAVSYNSGGWGALPLGVGDVNGDGKPDLVVLNQCPSENSCATGVVAILLGNGDGTFQAATSVPTPSLSSAGVLTLADFNGDGHLDIASSANQFLLLGNGDGTFQPYLNLGVGGQGGAVGDFNGDGKPDLAAGGVGVLLNIAANFHYATTTIVTSSLNPDLVGQSVSFTATVTPAFNASALTGSVTFYDGANALGTTAITNGQAVFSTSSLSVGTHSITASYTGDANYLPSTCAALTETVNTTVTTTTLTPSPNPSSYNQSVTFTVNVASVSGTPTGTVTVTDGATLLGTAILAGGNAGISISSLAAGSHSITASYGGDSNFSASSATVTQLVNQATTTATLLSSLDPSNYSQVVTFTATISGGGTVPPTGSVTFDDGSNSIGTVTLANGAASLSTSALAVGTHAINASYAGDNNFMGTNSAATSQVVSLAPTSTTVSSSANPAVINQSVTYTAVVSSPYLLPLSGTVTFKDGTKTLVTKNLSAPSYTTSYSTNGTHSITAVYSGDSNDSGSTSTVLTETINRIPTACTITSSVNPSSYGQTVTFTGTVSSAIGAPPNGETLTFKQLLSNGTELILGTGVLNAGVATFSISTLPIGTDKVKVTYLGDGKFANSYSAAVPQVINKISTTTTLSSGLNPSTFGQAVTLTVAVTRSGLGMPTGTVTFKNGTAVLGTATLSGGTAFLTTTKMPAGALTITALYGGDAQSTQSTGTYAQTVTPAVSTTAVISSVNPSKVHQIVKFTATVSSLTTVPTGSVTFMDGTVVLGTGTLTGGKASYNTSALSAGSYNITAVYGGTANISGSTSPVLVQTVN